MADNTDEERLDNPITPQSENPPDEITPTADTEPFNLNQETENMEVHHHAHDPAAPHHKKNWKSYFWEFLMLFLAVFCGFLAEYQLEHMIEKDRVKGLMINMVEDLQSDTSILKRTAGFQQNFNRRFDSIKADFRSMDKELQKRAYYIMGNSVLATMDFTYTRRTADQLRNTGSYRLIKNKMLLDSMLRYETYLKKFEEYTQAERLDSRRELIDLQTNFLDVDILIARRLNSLFSPKQKDSLLTGARPLNITPEMAKRYYNKLSMYNFDLIMQQREQQYFIERAEFIIKMIRSEYHLN